MRRLCQLKIAKTSVSCSGSPPDSSIHRKRRCARREAPHGTSELRRTSAFSYLPAPSGSGSPAANGAFSAALRETLRGHGGRGARIRGAGERRRGKPRGGENPEAHPVASRMLRSPAEEHRIPRGRKGASGFGRNSGFILSWSMAFPGCVPCARRAETGEKPKPSCGFVRGPPLLSRRAVRLLDICKTTPIKSPLFLAKLMLKTGVILS